MSSNLNFSSQCIFSICIVTLRRPDLLKRCLDSLSHQLQLFEPSHYEVIVSDDCQERSSYQVVLNSRFATWVQGPNRGVAANRNNAAKAAKGNWIVFLDDDEIADSNWLLTISQSILTDDFDVIEGKVEPLNFPDSILWYAPSISSGGLYCTANLAIRRQIFIYLGGFNELFAISHEDVEMGIRIRKAGLRSVYLSRAVVFHPARKISLQQVWSRMIDLQYQGFAVINLDNDQRTSTYYLRLFIFTLKYWYRVSRIELAACIKGHWKRPIQISFLLFLTIPFGFCKTLFNPVRPL